LANVANVDEMDKVVISRWDHWQFEREGVGIRNDVIGDSDGSLSEQTGLDVGVTQFDREGRVRGVPFPRNSDGRIANPTRAGGLGDLQSGGSEEGEGGEDGGKSEHDYT